MISFYWLSGSSILPFLHQSRTLLNYVQSDFQPRFRCWEFKFGHFEVQPQNYTRWPKSALVTFRVCPYLHICEICHNCKRPEQLSDLGLLSLLFIWDCSSDDIFELISLIGPLGYLQFWICFAKLLRSPKLTWIIHTLIKTERTTIIELPFPTTNTKTEFPHLWLAPPTSIIIVFHRIRSSFVSSPWHGVSNNKANFKSTTCKLIMKY